ncbi:PIN domain-containing protein [Sphingomonas sp.]|uniref:PIN domain-containing protein n=1 Tax=Sphingomonas sp. TaxID=28214 RepID=UPI0035BC58A4
MPGEFIDSNVLLYLTSADPGKAARAEQLIQRKPMVSVQVLNEITNVTRKKFRRTWSEVTELLGRLTPLLDVHPVTRTMHQDALRLAARYQMQWWDSLLAAAALSLDCHTLYSEDMHAGLVIDDQLTIVNPFAPA